MLTRCLLAAAFVTLAGAGTARTADFFLLDPNVASPGERVTVRPGAAGSETIPVRFNLYLVKNEDANKITSPDDPRLIPLGVIQIGKRGDGSLTFVVPEIAGGTYTLAHRRIGPCPHSGICGPAFYSAQVGDQIVPRYRPLMTLEVRVHSFWRSVPRAMWLVVLAVAAVTIASIIGLRRVHGTPARWPARGAPRL